MQKSRKKPLRRCAGCGESFDKRDLARVVRSPEGEYSVDPTGRKNGRGAYICINVDCLELARKRKGLNRSFKAEVPGEIFEKLREELTGGQQAYGKPAGTGSKGRQA
ncbi:MAG: YlxR family protein [Clostridiales bacterium]|jgi:predicted RNA-binding protein YlxR (DUF448 family)|nr:YlxR family protein [Clostridiales bacterium]